MEEHNYLIKDLFISLLVYLIPGICALLFGAYWFIIIIIIALISIWSFLILLENL